ncbi:MAG: recombinase family protein [Planctomycetes bacterium]|nr:recombinase family protein [Planctomycetota bacterium]MCH9727754.1 recombinase family protein [Planctomycetota bacterium]MCH9776921.1 recombinase family protein [Planctomycetota bacterium]MCH9790087.1 recombinase family protein [Planctomycetota bacterium]
MVSHEFQQHRMTGYARVSTSDQELSLQIDSLLKHGVKRERIFCDRLSGAKADRPGLLLCQECLRRGDTLLVWRLDRLGRSLRHLVTMIEDLKERGVGFRSICDGVIDTTTPSGELIFHVFSALTQFERRLIQERTKAGLAAARARGRKGSRPPLDPNSPRVVLAQKLFRDKSNCTDDICDTLKISSTTLYKYVSLQNTKDTWFRENV